MKINKHFFDRYEKFISHYKSIISEGCVERHHIVPVCLNGSNEIDNIVALPTRAHFIAHALLHKAYPEHRGLSHAFAMMIVNNPYQNRKIGSKLYALAKSARSNALKGVARSEETKAKLRKPKNNTENYKKPKSKEHALAISTALKGKPKSKAAIKNGLESKVKYFKAKKTEYELKVLKYKTLFLESNLSRSEFSDVHGINKSTMKKYLRGL